MLICFTVPRISFWHPLYVLIQEKWRNVNAHLISKHPKKTDENVTRSYFFCCLARLSGLLWGCRFIQETTTTNVILRQNNKSFAVNQWRGEKIETSTSIARVKVIYHKSKYSYDDIRGYMTELNKIKTRKYIKKNSHSITFIIILKQYSICRIGKEWREKNEERRNVVPSGEIWHASLSWISRTNREWCDVFENRFWKGLSALVCDLMIH